MGGMMKGNRRTGAPRVAVLLLLAGTAWAQTPLDMAREREFSDLLVLLDTPVVSASKTSEKLSEAPATVIVLRKEDLGARGYYQLSQLLDDLPGMQPERSYGDYYVKNYWRGFRNTQGDPYLLMVDGLVMNSLFYNSVEWAMVTLPLANVDHIEIVYGPASAVYGSNAFMGVINVLTTKDQPDSDRGQNALLTSGSNSLKVADAHLLMKQDAFRLSLAVRVENSLLDAEASQAYEYSKNRYYTDPGIWGRLVDSATMGGPHHSATDAKALDLRALWKNTELGLLYQILKTGYGNEYSADKAPNNQVWGRRHFSLWMKQNGRLSEDLSSTTTVRYLETGITPDSFYLESNTWAPGIPMGIDFQWYSVTNNSWAVNQDFEYKPKPTLSMTFGLKLERKDLQKGYETTPDYVAPVADFDPNAPDFPKPLTGANDPRNRILTEDRGIYIQGRWRFAQAHSFILGGRLDNNSIYGDAKTARLGYVGAFGRWSLKALFGQAYNEPTIANLYSSFSASKANPDLTPEKSATLEVSGSYTREKYSALLSLWTVKNTNTIVTKQNLGQQKFTGADLHLRYLTRPDWARQFSAWAYLSHIFQNEGSNHPDPTGAVSTTGLTKDGNRVGDLARTQLKAGTTLELSVPLTLTLLSRYVSSIETIASNPLGRVDAYLTVDAIAAWTAVLGVQGLGLTLKVANLTNKTYFHPGFADANAGNTPGYWADGVYHGSGGFYSSLLAQPGRNLQLTMGIVF